MENNQSFEAILQELEEIVKKLEDKELPLEESVKLYQRGVELSNIASIRLKEQEKLIVEKMTDKGIEEFTINE